MRSIGTLTASILIPIGAGAHSHHTSSAVGLDHHLSDPFHIAMGIFTIGAALLILTWRLRRRRAAFAHRLR